MAGFRTLDDIGDVAGKRVLVRVDLNVPVTDGKASASPLHAMDRWRRLRRHRSGSLPYQFSRKPTLPP